MEGRERLTDGEASFLEGRITEPGRNAAEEDIMPLWNVRVHLQIHQNTCPYSSTPGIILRCLCGQRTPLI